MPRTTTVVEDPWTKNLKFDYRRKDETGKSEDPSTMTISSPTREGAKTALGFTKYRYR